MKKLLLILGVFFIASSAFAGDTYVRGCYRRDGTYVQPYYRSSSDQYKYNNYGAKPRKDYNWGYTNPYSRDRDKDAISNQYDWDDDNDGIGDDYE